MYQYRIVLGIEIRRNLVRLAEMEQRDDGFFLSRVGEKILQTLELDELVEKISLLISEEAMLGRIASIAIDSTLTERETIDVDSDLQDREIVDFLNAELEFHNDFSGQVFRPAFEITKTSDDGYKEVFYAAVNKSLLSIIKDSCTRCGLDLQFIDLDHSCSELAISKLLAPSGAYILVSVKDRHIEGGFCKNGERLVYKYLNYEDEPFYFVTKMAQDLESAGKEYAEKIYLSGARVDNFLVDMLQKNADSRYELLAPTSKLLLSSAVSEDENFIEHPYLFSSAIGAALK